MRAIMVMFDSLNKDFLQPYGCEWTQTPNFNRLAQKTVKFQNNFVGSLPCMPARRELQTGRINFLHRSWGPMEPFDDSMPQILKTNGIYSHLVSDHGHYWEDGGATYHTRYSSWEIARGQEGDPWKGIVDFEANRESAFVTNLLGVGEFKNMWRQDEINRQYTDTEEKMPQAVTFSKGLEFLKANVGAQNWFLQIETFDPHEPFFTTEEYKKLYGIENTGASYEWPPYGTVQEDTQTKEIVRKTYAALLSMCDAHLGKVLDFMDEHHMWEDTMIIVNTDHGYLLGEHDWWSKTVMPIYNEIANTPLFIWDPRIQIKNETRSALTQTIDLAPTILDFFQLPIPPDMEGKPLREVMATDEPIRQYAVFGQHGGHLNITDGHYVYMRAPAHYENKPLYDYTLMPTHMRKMFSVNELKAATLDQGFPFTKGCPVLKIPVEGGSMTNPFQFGNKLFDLKEDPKEEKEIQNVVVEQKMIGYLQQFLHQHGAPVEQFQRLGIPFKGEMTIAEIETQKASAKEEMCPNFLVDYDWEQGVYAQWKGLISLVPLQTQSTVKKQFENAILKNPETHTVTENHLRALAKGMFQGDILEFIYYMMSLWKRS